MDGVYRIKQSVDYKHAGRACATHSRAAMQAAHTHTWGLQRPAPREHAQRGEFKCLTREELRRVCGWLWENAGIDQEAEELEVDDKVSALLDRADIDCVIVRRADLQHLPPGVVRALDNLAQGDKNACEEAVGWRHNRGYLPRSRHAKLMPEGYSFRTQDAEYLSMQVVALRVLYARFYTRSKSAEFSPPDHIWPDELHFRLKWEWLTGLPWMENEFAQDIEVQGRASDADFRVVRKRPLAEAAYLLYSQASSRFLFDVEFFGNTCLFYLLYKGKRHSIIAYMALYGAFICFNLKSDTEHVPDLPSALRKLDSALGGQPLPNIFSLALDAPARYAWARRYALVHPDPWRCPLMYAEREQPLANYRVFDYLKRCAVELVSQYGLGLERITKHVEGVTFEHMEMMEADVFTPMFYKDSPLMTQLDSEDLYPGVPLTISFLLAAHVYDLRRARTMQAMGKHLPIDLLYVVGSYEPGVGDSKHHS
jgi:hypothetical protein